MNFWKILVLWLAVPATFILCSAHIAAAQWVQVCIVYETEYSDYSMGDYYTDPGVAEYDAIRPYVQIYDNDAGSYVFNDYISSANCTPILSLPATHDFNVKVLARANLGNNNRIFVKDDRTNQQLHAQTVAANWNPLFFGSYTFTYELTAGARTSNILAAVSRSLYNRPAGVSGIDIVYFTEACDVGATEGSCYRYIVVPPNPGEHRVFLGNISRSRKRTPSHETGHALANKMNDNLGNDYNCQNMETPCTNSIPDNSHCNECLEYQSCAAWEGFADFYMIQSWNNKNDGDCDYDDQGTSCEDGGNYISRVPCCTGSDCNGRGTESDWAHFWWDLYTKEDCSTADINQIMTYSNPELWVDDNYPEPNWRNTIYLDIRSGAFNNDLCETNWDTYAGDDPTLGNGVYH